MVVFACSDGRSLQISAADHGAWGALPRCGVVAGPVLPTTLCRLLNSLIFLDINSVDGYTLQVLRCSIDGSISDFRFPISDFRSPVIGDWEFGVRRGPQKCPNQDRTGYLLILGARDGPMVRWHDDPMAGSSRLSIMYQKQKGLSMNSGNRSKFYIFEIKRVNS
jgi:hypothetical protein